MAILPPVLGVACSSAGVATQPGPAVSRPVLTMADWEAPGTLDPAQATTLARLRADTLVYARLWIPGPDGRLVPDLAATVPRAAGGRLTVRLRPGLRWSDGSPLTAGDIVRSCTAQCGGIAAVELHGDRVRFDTADPHRLDSVFIAPAAPTGAVASGPFRLAASSATRLRFERNPRYHGHPPYLAEVDLVIATGHDAMVEAAQAGEFDYLPHLGPADLPTGIGGLRTVVTTSERVEVLAAHGLSPATIAALSFGVQRAALSEQAFGGRAQPVGGLNAPAVARTLLGGQPLDIALVTACDDPVRADESTALVAQMSAIGVTLHPACAPVDQVLAPAGAQLSLYALRGPPPAGSVPLLRWPAVRAVSPDVHGFEPNDWSGTDLWNVADWWLS